MHGKFFRPDVTKLEDIETEKKCNFQVSKIGEILCSCYKRISHKSSIIFATSN